MFSQINVLRLLMTVNFGQISNHVTDRCLSSVTFSTGDICKIIQNVNSNKAHRYDNVSFRVLKVFGDIFNEPL